MTRTRIAILGLTLGLMAPVAGRAQGTTATPSTTKAAAPKPKEESQAKLKKEAKITLSAAEATALAAVPGGKIKAHELEREKGKLIYSFDIKVSGKSGIEEVAVDAITGTMIEKTHETPADEAKEAAADKKAAAKKPIKPPPPPTKP